MARQPKAWTTAKIVGTARRELNKLAQGRADEYKRIGKFADFQKLWVTTGIAHLVKGKVRVGVFDSWQHETGPVNTRALFVATDGSGLKDGRAGYGCVGRWLGPGDDPAVAPRPDEPPTFDECGPVVTNATKYGYLGATKGSNNTGELSGLCRGLERALPHTLPGDEVHALSDSMLAICATSGAWRPKCHHALVARCKKAVAALRMRGVRVSLRHVRAHRGHAMNERADTLAGLGAQGVRMRDGRPFDPPDYPDPSHARSATPVRPLLPPDTVPD